MLVGFFSISPTISTLMNNVTTSLMNDVPPWSVANVTIGSNGTLATRYNVTAGSGSSEDIQEAIDVVAAAGGGTVYIPEGNFTFVIDPAKVVNGKATGVMIPGGVNVIGAGNNKTILQQPADPTVFSSMFYVDGSNGMPVRISGIKFDGYVSDEAYGNIAIVVYNAIDFRIDNNFFEDFSSKAMSIENFDTGRNKGVIDHNVIDNPYKDTIGGIWGYGIIIVGKAYQWEDITKLLGKYDTYDGPAPLVYIEDNEFIRTRHAIASNQGAWYVARYNTFREPRLKNFGMIDTHGDPGALGLEAYNNELYAASGYASSVAMWIRGGSGVIFNNTIIDCLYGVQLFKETYPVSDMYIWNNNYINVANSFTNGGYTENVDYFLYARTGYQSYPYPHPLILEAAP